MSFLSTHATRCEGELSLLNLSGKNEGELRCEGELRFIKLVRKKSIIQQLRLSTPSLPRTLHALPTPSSPLLNAHRRLRRRHLFLFLALLCLFLAPLFLFLALLSVGPRNALPSRLLHDDPALVATPSHRIPETPLIIGGDKLGVIFVRGF